MLIASEPDKFYIKVVTSPVRTDHKAILATTTKDIRDRAKRSTTKIIRKRSPNQHANHLHDLASFDTSHHLTINGHPPISMGQVLPGNVQMTRSLLPCSHSYSNQQGTTFCNTSDQTPPSAKESIDEERQSRRSWCHSQQNWKTGRQS